MKSIILIIFYILIQTVHADTVIGILDSGFDLTHDSLSDKVYENPNELLNGKDDDRNGAIDDILGWNLLDNNEVLFNEELRGTFPSSVFKYYRLRAKKSLGTITSDELAWYEKMLKDEEFKKLRKGFTSFIHGTHVTGIALSAEGVYSNSKILFKPIRYLGKREEGKWVEPKFTQNPKLKGKKGITYLKSYLQKFTTWQMKKLEAGIRLASNQVEIINGSFGKSFKSLLSSIEKYYEIQFDKKPSEEMKKELALYFGSILNTGTERVVSKFSKVLFVFSAGNSKDDNDIYPHYPSNARKNNVIAVGASKGHTGRAYFSNFGAKTVDVFAPGLAIESSIPGNSFIRVNGTSQASPFIANLAAKILERAKTLNINLTISDLKKIIIETVDKKDSMKSDSVSGGIANSNRAILALNLSRKMSLPKAIKIAKERVEDINPITKSLEEEIALLVDLPSPF